MSMRDIELAIEEELKRRMATAEYKGREKQKLIFNELEEAKALSANRKTELAKRAKEIEDLEAKVKNLKQDRSDLRKQIKAFEAAEKEAAEA